jgi:two-component system, chemotaxis family, CheB/CheR fusion protein
MVTGLPVEPPPGPPDAGTPATPAAANAPVPAAVPAAPPPAALPAPGAVARLSAPPTRAPLLLAPPASKPVFRFERAPLPSAAAGSIDAPKARPLRIVALGASAGGLEAYEQFFRLMPVDSGLAFVLIQHLDPSHPSMLAEILQRSTPMPVVEVQDQMTVEPNHLYVIPPNRDMGVTGRTLTLVPPLERRGLRLPIDSFLTALAADQGPQSAGIVLSGTGSDGTLGLRALSQAGGLCLVQEPTSALYDGMPTSALHGGGNPRVMPIDRMVELLRSDPWAEPGEASGPTLPPDVLARILEPLRLVTGHDFSLYKKATLSRRIERRMAQHDIRDPEVYARYLHEQPDEINVLFRELLINVTRFFRDPAAFEVLKRDILPALLEGKPAGYVLRIWVAGCSTGEEAYSIAMLLREWMDESHREHPVQFYGTDLDDDAIAFARIGLYPHDIALDVSPERLKRFFIWEDAGYRIRKEVRERVIFAVQSVIKDPPFTRLDLLSCRNLMIYLEPALQNRLIATFHYALKPGGVLFLSPSESIGGHADLFEPLHRHWKLYRARASSASTLALLTGKALWAAAAASPPLPESSASRLRDSVIGDLARRAMLHFLAPAAVVVDARGTLFYLHGDTRPYLQVPPGHPTHNLLEMATPALQPAVREALMRATGQGASTVQQRVEPAAPGSGSPAMLLSLRPLPDNDGNLSLFLVSFEPAPPLADLLPHRPPRRKRRAEPGAASAPEAQTDAGGDANISDSTRLALELNRVRQDMATLLEAQHLSTEELKSTNEELQSTNEELQSTNEELETSREELQSVNEELITVNSELQSKIEQMASIQDDMKNLLDNIRVGTLFLDTRLCLRRYTRDATRLYRLTATDVGRPLSDIRSEVQGRDLLVDAQQVLDTLVPVELEVSTRADQWFQARIQPYRTVDNVIDGVVLTFADISERVQATQAMRKARDLAEAVIDTMHDALVVLDDQFRIVSANRAYYREFGGTAAGTLGQPFFTLQQGQWDSPALHALLETRLPAELNVEGAVLEHDFAALGHRRLRFSARRVVEQADNAVLVLLGIESLAAIRS